MTVRIVNMRKLLLPEVKPCDIYFIIPNKITSLFNLFCTKDNNKYNVYKHYNVDVIHAHDELAICPKQFDTPINDPFSADGILCVK